MSPVVLAIVTLLGSAGVGGVLGWVLRRSRSMRSSAPAGQSEPGFVVPRELPPPPVPFVGRDEEIGRITEWLRGRSEGGPRVAVITGPAGIGKSALAVHVAHLLAGEFPDGQLFTRTESFADGPDPQRTQLHRISGAFVYALQGEDDEVPTGTEARLDRLRELTSGRRVLMIVDALTSPDLLPPFLRSGPGCGVIVTSRGSLPDLGPDALALPLSPLSEDDSVALLGAVVGDQVSEYQEAARQIVRISGHNPLALRLAGASLAGGPYRDLALAVERIRRMRRPVSAMGGTGQDRGELDSTYALLPAMEQDALGRLSLLDSPVFAPWMLAQLLDTTEEQAWRIADRLVRAGLVERASTDLSGIPRFRVLDRVREYATQLRGPAVPDDRRGLAKLRAEREARNRKSLDRTLRGDVFVLLERGHLTGAVRAARRTVALAREQGEPGPRGLALAALAELQLELGSIAEAVELAQEARRTGDPRSQVRALRSLGKAERYVRKLTDAEGHLNRALELCRPDDDSERIRVLCELAVVEALGSDTRRGEAHATEALTLCRRRPDQGRRLHPRALWAHAVVLREAGRLDHARSQLAAAASRAEASELLLLRTWIAHQAGLVALSAGDLDRAGNEASKALTRFGAMRHRYGSAHARLVLGQIRLRSGQVGSAAQLLEEALETFRNCGDRWVEAFTTQVLVDVLTGAGRNDEAAGMSRIAAWLFNEVGDQARSSDAAAASVRLGAQPAGEVPPAEAVR